VFSVSKSTGLVVLQRHSKISKHLFIKNYISTLFIISIMCLINLNSFYELVLFVRMIFNFLNIKALVTVFTYFRKC